MIKNIETIMTTNVLIPNTLNIQRNKRKESEDKTKIQKTFKSTFNKERRD